jgi:hypothetical protein
MVKVSGGARSARGAVAHLAYIDRHGELAFETDDGRTLQGRNAAADIANGWDLDTLQSQSRTPYRGTGGRAPGKLVHNIVFSMPKATPPEKLRRAVKGFAREQFDGTHRYAMVLHTDHDHPHMHLVVRAINENGLRLNIRKDTLREWRARFAHQLRAQGVAANATTRAERGQIRAALKDGIYRSARRGQSRYLGARRARIAQALRSGTFQSPPGKLMLLNTRRAVVEGWRGAANALLEAGQIALAERIWAFVGRMPQPLTTDEQMAAEMLRADRTRQPDREPPTR